MEEFWHGTWNWFLADSAQVQYNYCLKNEDGTSSMKWGRWPHHRACSERGRGNTGFGYLEPCRENWKCVFYGSFQKVLLKHNRRASRPDQQNPLPHIFKIKAPLLKKDEILVLLGKCSPLSEWDTESAIPMILESYCGYASSLPKESFRCLQVCGDNLKHKKSSTMKQGSNRILQCDANDQKGHLIHERFVSMPK